MKYRKVDWKLKGGKWQHCMVQYFHWDQKDQLQEMFRKQRHKLHSPRSAAWFFVWHWPTLPRLVNNKFRTVGQSYFQISGSSGSVGNKGQNKIQGVRYLVPVRISRSKLAFFFFLNYRISETFWNFGSRRQPVRTVIQGANIYCKIKWKRTRNNFWSLLIWVPRWKISRSVRSLILAV